MKVLITGAAGFIGSELLRKFKREGYEVVAWDRNESRIDEIEISCVDLLDEEALIENLKIVLPDIVIHCAGSADVGKSVKNPAMDYEGNVTITHNLLFSLHKAGLDKVHFVFLSSAGVYGNPIALPITEDMPLNPLSPYAVHKVMCEDLCMYFAKNYGMDVKIARIFSAYGKGLRKQIFWDMHNKALKRGRLDMFGTGNESRDYIHVKDVIQAIHLLATVNSDSRVFNVANGEEVTIKQVTEIFANCAGIAEGRIAFNGVVREGDPLNWRADISRISRMGYKKTVEIHDGISEYVKWVGKV